MSPAKKHRLNRPQSPVSPAPSIYIIYALYYMIQNPGSLSYVMSTMFEVIFTEPADCGFAPVARRRSFTIYIRKDSAKFVSDPQTLYDRMCFQLRRKQIRWNDLVWADKGQVEEDLQKLTSNTSRTRDDLFTESEKKNIAGYKAFFEEKGTPLEEQVYVPTQNPSHRPKALKRGVLPLFTATDKMVWIEGLKRPLTSLEKFAAHGWPVTADLAKELSVQASQPKWLNIPYKHIFPLVHSKQDGYIPLKSKLECGFGFA